MTHAPTKTLVPSVFFEPHSPGIGVLDGSFCPMMHPQKRCKSRSIFRPVFWGEGSTGIASGFSQLGGDCPHPIVRRQGSLGLSMIRSGAATPFYPPAPFFRAAAVFCAHRAFGRPVDSEVFFLPRLVFPGRPPRMESSLHALPLRCRFCRLLVARPFFFGLGGPDLLFWRRDLMEVKGLFGSGSSTVFLMF